MTGKSRGFTMVPYTFVRYQSFTEAAELSVRKYPPPNIEWPLLELWLSSRSINLKWCDILQFSCLVSCIAHVRNLLRKKTCQHCKIEIKTQNWNWRKKNQTVEDQFAPPVWPPEKSQNIPKKYLSEKEFGGKQKQNEKYVRDWKESEECQTIPRKFLM